MKGCAWRRCPFLLVRALLTLLSRLALRLMKLLTACLVALVLFWCVYGSLFAFILLLTVVAVALYQLQDRLLYFPSTPADARHFICSPAQFGMYDFESVFLTTDDHHRLHGFLIKQSGRSDRVPTVLFLHGNAGNIGHRMPNAKLLYEQCGFNIFLLEYRGYGRSSGEPSEYGLYADARTALLYLLQRRDLDPDQLMLFGRSLGGAVAVHLAVHSPHIADRLLACVLENTFTSIPDMARIVIPFSVVHHIPIFLFKNQFNTRQLMEKMKVSTLFISGVHDQLVPECQMDMLYSECGSLHKRMRKLEGDHNDTWTNPIYCNVLKQFVQECLLRRGAAGNGTRV